MKLLIKSIAAVLILASAINGFKTTDLNYISGQVYLPAPVIQDFDGISDSKNSRLNLGISTQEKYSLKSVEYSPEASASRFVNESAVDESNIILNFGTANEYFSLFNSGNTPFAGLNFGPFECDGSFILNGAQQKTHKCGDHNISYSELNYSIEPAGTAHTSFTSVEIFYQADLGTFLYCSNTSNDQNWETAAEGINLLAGLSPGNYELQVYTIANYESVTDGNGVHFISNFDNNFTATFTVVDNSQPVIESAPADITIACLTDLPTMVDLNWTDNCDAGGTVTGVDSALSGNNYNGTITRTWNISDSNGNAAATQTQIITINDNIPPVIESAPADITIACLTDLPTMVDLNWTDNCDTGGTVTSVDSALSGTNSNGIITRTWNVSDSNGNNAATQTQIITINDNIPPVIESAPADITIACLTDLPTMVDLNWTDNCDAGGTVTGVDSALSGNNYNGTITRTWNISDSNGNAAATQTQIITINDNIPPVIESAPADITIACLTDLPTMVDLNWTDNCDAGGTVTGVDSALSGNNYNGTITRTWNISDSNGNAAATQTQIITINDNIPPVIESAPADITIACLTDLPTMVDLNWTDNCDTGGTVTSVDSALSGTNSNGIITRTWNVSDSNGNNAATQTQIITINDNIPPVIESAPADITIACLTDLPTMVDLNWTDNCDAGGTVTGVDSALSGNNYNGTITRTWNISDSNGNAAATQTQIITINDNIPPVIESAPADINIACLTDLPTMVDLNWTDNCDAGGTVTGVDSALSGNNYNGTITRTWNISDSNGNAAATQTQIITINDNIPPVIESAPADITIACLTDLPTMVDLNWTDNCDTGGTVTGVDSALSGTNSNGTITRTWNVSDSNGNNAATQTQIITINDNIPPVIESAPADITIACFSNLPAMVDLNWTDNCDAGGTVTGVDSALSGNNYNGTITRTWNISDSNGNAAATQTQIITINDNIPPVIESAPADITIACLTDLPTMVDLNWTDNCDAGGTVTGVDSALSGNNYNGTITRTWNISDSNGNAAATQTQIITINDNIPPVITITGANPQTVEACTSYTELGATATDNCAGDISSSIVIDASAVNTSVEGSYVVTYNVIDGNGNSATQVSRTVEVVDTTLPTIITQDITVQLDASGNASITPNDIDNGSSDNCGTINLVSVSPNIFTCADLGNNSVTLTVNDGNGNTNTGTATVTVEDLIPPTVSCPGDITISNDTGDCGATVTWTAPTGADNCSVASVNSSHNPGDTFPVGTTTVTYTATDSSGLTAQCSFDVTVNDTEDPIAQCIAGPLTVELSNNGTAFVTTDQVDNGSSDNCGNVSLGFSGPGATLSSGQNVALASNGASASQSSTGFGGLASRAIDGNTNGNWSNNSITHTNTGIGEWWEVTFSSDQVIDRMRIWGRTNCCKDRLNDFTVQVRDAGNNIISSQRYQQNFNENLWIDFFTGVGRKVRVIQNENKPLSIAEFQVFSVDGARYNFDCDDVTTDIANPNPVPVTLTVTDEAGNVATCVRDVIVVDNIAPVIDCKPTLFLSFDNNCNVDTNLITQNENRPTASDNCSSGNQLTYTNNLAAISPLQPGENTLTWTVTDASGNSTTCEQIIDVEDNRPPTIDTCPTDVILNTDIGQCDAVFNYAIPTFTDCSDITVTMELGLASGSAFPIGETTVSYRATDASGFSEVCTFTVTVIDNENPILNCPADLTLNCEEDSTPAGAAGSATATDNCDTDVTVAFSDALAPGPGNNSVITRTWTATDDAGNAVSCEQTITIVDTTDPVLNCPANVTVQCDGDTTPAFTGTATATDNCATPTVSFTDTEAPGTGNNKVITRTWTAVDANGNSVSCDQIITVQDTTPPVVTCLPNLTVALGTAIECDAANANLTDPSNTGTPAATDNCDTNPNITYTDSQTNGTGNNYTITRSWTIEDANGNFTLCNQIIEVVDTTGPDITCPTDITVECDADTSPAATGQATATDACDSSANVTISFADVVNPGSGNGSTITRTWTAVDSNGNPSSSCTQTITLEDTTAPTLSCGPDLTDANTSDDGLGNCGTTVSLTLPTVSDNCGSTSLSYTLTGATTGSGDVADIASVVFNTGTTTITWIATDEGGLASAPCEQQVIVADNELPVINVPTDIIVNNCTTGVFFNVTATDNCDGNLTSSLVRLDSGPNSGQTFPPGTTTISYEVTDSAGNYSGIVSFDVIVSDSTDPVINCPEDITTNASPGQCSATVLYNINASDDCPSSVLSWTMVNGGNTIDSGSSANGDIALSNFPLGTTTITYTITDAGVNSATCSFDITVVDATAPTIDICPAPVTAATSDDGTGDCGTTITTLVPPTVSDNCTIVPPSISYSLSGATTGSGAATAITSQVFEVGVTQIEWIVEDAAGLTTTCTQEITVVDDEAPSINPIAVNSSYPTDTDACTASLSFTAVPVDNCSTTTISYTIGGSPITFPYAFPIGTTTVTAIANDGSNADVTQDFDVNVVDQQDPNAICQDITLTLDDSGVASILPADLDNGSTDNCDNTLTLTVDQDTFSCADIGSNTVTLTVTDDAGNSSSCTATVTILDPGSTASVSITASPDFPACFEDTVTFTANVTDAGLNPTFQWYQANNPVPGEISSTFTPTDLQFGDEVYVVLFAGFCDYPVTSNTLTASYNPTPVISGEDEICVTGSINLSPSTGGTWTSSNPSVATITNAGVATGVAVGSVTFTFTDSVSGCSATSQSVNVVNLPALTFPATLCENETFQLLPETGGTWSSNNPSIATVTPNGMVTAIAEGSVSFTFTKPSGCAVSTPSVTIDESPEIIEITSSSSETFCSADDTELEAVVTNGSFGTNMLVNYNFNSGTSFASLDGQEATGINCEVGSNELPFQLVSPGRVTTGGNNGAFVQNNVAGSGLNATTTEFSSNGGYRNFTFTLTGAELSNYETFNIYFDAKRESGTNFTKEVYVLYQVDGGTQTDAGGRLRLDNDNWANYRRGFNASPNSTLRVILQLRGTSSSDVLIDNFQIQGVAPDPGLNYSWTASPAATAGLPINADIPSSANRLISVNPTETTTYTLTVENIRGCVTTEDITVNVLPSPEINIIANYCPSVSLPNAVVELTPFAGPIDTTGWTWTWSTGETTETIYVDIAGTYEVIGTPPNGCSTIGSIGVAEELVIDGSFSNFDADAHEANINNGTPQLNDFTSGQIFVKNLPGRINNQGELWVDTGLLGYTVAEDAYDTHRLFRGLDHTNNNDGLPQNFMVINGDGLVDAWRQPNTPVRPNTTYYFSAWVQRVIDGNPPRLQFQVNGQLTGTSIVPPPRGCGNLNDRSCDRWVRFYGTWNSGSNTTADIFIVNLNGGQSGNDYGLDDISFATLSTFVNLVSDPTSENQDLCANTLIEPISYSVGAELSFDAGGNLQGPVITWTDENGVIIPQPDGITTSFNGVVYNIEGEPTTPGTYNYEVVTGACDGGDPKIVSGQLQVNPKPIVDITEDSRLVCRAENSIPIEALTSFDGQPVPAGQWTTSGDGNFADATNPTTSYNFGPTDSGTITLTYTIDNSAAPGLCSESLDSIEIEINPYIEPVIASGSITTSSCDVTEFNLSANGTIGQWTVESGQDAGSYSFSDETDPNATFTGISGETYTLRWSIDNGGPCGVTLSADAINLAIPDCGTSINFDGTDDVIDFRNNFGYTNAPFSMEIWIKPEVIKSQIQSIISKRNANDLSSGFDLRLVSNELSFYANNTKVVSTTGMNRNRWFHVAVTYNGSNYTLYVDGVNVDSGSGPAPLDNTYSTLVGAMSIPNDRPEHHYFGWIDEIRFWSTALTAQQIRETMNQEIEANGALVRGVDIPITISDGLQWSQLDGYYKLNASSNSDVETGLVKDVKGGIDGILRNMTGTQPETAPIPYESAANGAWTSTGTWLNGGVTRVPNSMGIDAATRIDWNIVRINHIVTSGNNNISVLGLDVFDGRLSIQNSSPADGQLLYVDKYLEIGDGVLDLVGESQLIQGDNSTALRSGNGYLERDQQGSKSLYNYNYWGSPVSSDPSGTGYTVRDILFNGTNPNNVLPISWTSGINASYNATNLTMSGYWIYSFEDKDANDYFGWVQERETGFFNRGLGFTMKGSGSNLSEQNYAFRGEPNNGTITAQITAQAGGENRTLVGNPYPSALDANEFILDNVPGQAGSTESIDGTLYFWRMSTTNNSHFLADYLGGYATYTLSGGVQAATAASEIAGLGDASNLRPERFIPVSQGFFISSSAFADQVSNLLEFRNSQRAFVKETANNSIFLRQPKLTAPSPKGRDGDTVNNDYEADPIQRVRFAFKTPEGASVPYLLAFTPDNQASDAFDYGYDAKIIDQFPNYMSFMIEDEKYNIQGVGTFDTTKRYPIGIFLETGGDISIELTETENFDEDIDVYIYDGLTDTYTQINEANFQLQLEAGNHLGRFEITFEDQNRLSVQKPEKDENFRIYYARERDKIVIMNPQGMAIESLEVFNILGQSVKKFDVERQQNYYEFPFYNIQAATYVAHVKSEDGIKILKFIVDGLRD